MDQQEFKVFYAWQSDSPNSTNRGFIETAIEAALKSMKATGVVEASPRMDRDTKGVPGMPDIANTILEKIHLADAFIADISFVGKAVNLDPDDEKLLPNSNVMIELGYALAEVGWERIVCVLNRTSGSPDDLPFDLRHRRWPLEYELAKDADADARSTQKKKLVKGLQSAIEAIAALPAREKEMSISDRLVVLERTISTLGASFAGAARSVGDLTQASSFLPVPANNPQSLCIKLRDALIERINSGSFNNVTPHQPMIILTICPGPREAPLSLSQKEDMLALRLRPLYASGWNHRRYGDRFVTVSEDAGGIGAVTEIDGRGIINAGDRRMLSLARQFLSREAPEDVCIIPSIAFEKSAITEVQSYLTALRELGAEGPWAVALGLIGLRKSILSVAPRLFFDGRIFEGEAILPPVVQVPADVDLDDPQMIARALRPAFDYVWREHNYPQSLDYNEGGEWVGH